ncbi:MAG: signal peptidase II [Deltaproteobacteria bacterium]|nr:signal peptidase II [Deltaproteobacteria bacterium]
MKKRLILIVIFALLSLGLDQVTKMWARAALQGQHVVRVIDNYLLFAYHENTGMAFGIGRNLPGGRFILVGIGLLVLAIVWRIVRNVQRRQRLADIAYGLVAGGAIGNIVDRLWLGRVVDFIVMHWKHKHAWPAYNIADAVLVVGVGLMLIAIAGEGRPNDDAATAKSKGGKNRRGKKRSS